MSWALIKCLARAHLKHDAPAVEKVFVKNIFAAYNFTSFVSLRSVFLAMFHRFSQCDTFLFNVWMHFISKNLWRLSIFASSSDLRESHLPQIIRRNWLSIGAVGRATDLFHHCDVCVADVRATARRVTRFFKWAAQLKWPFAWSTQLRTIATKPHTTG